MVGTGLTRPASGGRGAGATSHAMGDGAPPWTRQLPEPRRPVKQVGNTQADLSGAPKATEDIKVVVMSRKLPAVGVGVEHFK